MKMLKAKTPLEYSLEEMKLLQKDRDQLKKQLNDKERDLKFTRNERDLLENELNLVKRERDTERQKHNLLREYIFLNG